MTIIAPYFLIAMPTLTDPNFAQSVVMVVPSTGDGQFGLIINKRTGLLIDRLGEEEKKEALPHPLRSLPLDFGGPSMEENVIFVGKGPEEPAETVKIEDDIFLGIGMAFVKEKLEESPDEWQFRAFAGHAGWSTPQLEAEITQSAWLKAPFDSTLLFDTPMDKIWGEAIKLLGFDPTQLATESSTMMQ